MIQYGGRALMFGEPITGSVAISCLMNMTLQSFFLWICHVCVSKCGMIFVESEILRTGNEQLLNDLEEGVVIVHPDTLEIVFINTTAKAI